MKTSFGPRTLLYPAPALIVGTYDKVMKPNGMTAAWSGICCSKPPCVYVSLRKATYTHGNIVERKAFTLNIPSEEMLEKVDYFGMASGREEDKFAVTGLTPVQSELVDAPYVEECPMVLECRLKETVELGLHTQFVGEVLDVKADESVLGEDGVPDMGKVKPLVFAPESRGYYGLGAFLGRAFSVGKRLR
ncbi:MAG: flavin reductase family protein [Deltaproteobacteria bacterium]|nr:flavin reductase family protein [Deltaproteobacteria bacterium]